MSSVDAALEPVDEVRQVCVRLPCTRECIDELSVIDLPGLRTTRPLTINLTALSEWIARADRRASALALAALDVIRDRTRRS